VARTEMSHEEFRRRMREAVRDHGRVQPPSEYVWERFAQALYYLPGDPKDLALYTELKAFLSDVDQRRGGPATPLSHPPPPPSPGGTVIPSPTSRSRSPRPSAWRHGARTTRRRAPCATWCRTTCSSSSASSPWSRP